MSIRLNPKNSKIIDGRVFITSMKVHSLKSTLKSKVINGSRVEHPTLGTLYEYVGEYTRSNKVTPED